MNHTLAIDGRNIYDVQGMIKWTLSIFVLVVYQVLLTENGL